MSAQPPITSALAEAQASGLDRLDAQMLLLHVVGRPVGDRAWLLAHDGDVLSDAVLASFRGLVHRRLQGEPVAYLVGHKEFHGLDFAVDSRVLVPRPDTETVVDWAIELLKQWPDDGPSPKVLDLGTGSGAIALSIRHDVPQASVTACDVSVDSLAVARANSISLRLADVTFVQSDWFSAIQGRFDLIVSNPPYIAAADPHLAALKHEPLGALHSGADGLDDLHRIVREAPNHLTPGGWLLLEHGWDQAAAVRALLLDAGFSHPTSRKDLAGIERCSGAQIGNGG